MMNEYLELELVSNVGGIGGSFVAYASCMSVWSNRKWL